MKTTELRIGNIVNAYKVGVCRVDGIESDILISTANDEYIPINDVEGIPLTEQWLLDLGFVKNEYGKMSLSKEFEYLEIICVKEEFYPSYEQPAEFAHESDRVVFLRQIKYVHQLQNLYFALTQEELILKERSKE